jgi:hypothetical protein
MTRSWRLALAAPFVLWSVTGCGGQASDETAPVANNSHASEETTRVVPLDGFRPSSVYDKAVQIDLVTGIGEHLRSVRVLNEDNSSVTIEVRVTTRTGTAPDLGLPNTLSVSLQRPLGQRQVLEPGGQSVPRIDSLPSAK